LGGHTKLSPEITCAHHNSIEGVVDNGIGAARSAEKARGIVAEAPQRPKRRSGSPLEHSDPSLHLCAASWVLRCLNAGTSGAWDFGLLFFAGLELS
jgi:hypothetical protein